MKNIIDKSFFILKLVFKNLIEHPLRSILIGLGFFGLFIALFATFSMDTLMYQYYVGQIEDVYHDFDVKMSIDQYGDQRFFSIRDLNEAEISDQIKSYHPFFEFNVLANSGTQSSYVHVYASDIQNLEKISNQDVIIDTLLENEVIVTRSYAKNNEITIGDFITLYASDEQEAFLVKEIVEDQYLFSGYSIFIDKDMSLSFFLSSLSPTLEGFPQILLRNLYNHVYIDLYDSSSYQSFHDTLQDYPDFNHLSIRQIYDQVEINKDVKEMTSLFQVILWIIFSTILLVLSTTLKVFSFDRQKFRSTLHFLGAHKRFSYMVISIELFLMIVISFICSIIATNYLISRGYAYLGSSASYQLSIADMFYVLTIILVMTGFTFYMYQQRFKNQTDVSRLNIEVDHKKINILKHFIVFLFLVLMYVIAVVIFKEQKISVICAILAIIGLSYIGIRLIIYIILWFIKRLQILYLFIKKSLNKNQFYHLLMTQLTIFIVIFLLVFTIFHLNRRTETFVNETDFDLVVSSVTGDIDEIFTDLQSNQLVTDVDKFDQYTYVEINELHQHIETLISIDPLKIDTYFNFNIDQQVLESFNDQSIPKIILPRIYEEVYDQQSGQFIHLKINENYQDVKVEIAGFYEKEAIEVAFVNLNAFDAYASLTNYQLVINSMDKTLLKSQLVREYGSQMIIVSDYQREVIEPLFEDMKLVRNYLTYIIVFMIISFIVSLFNHYTMMFYQNIYDDSKLYAIGMSKKTYTGYMIKSQLLIFIGLLLTSSIIFLMFMQILPDFITLFNVYERIELNVKMMMIGTFINLIVFIVLVSYQIVLIKKSKYMQYLSVK